MTFSWLDGVILVVLVLSIFSAARRGFSREVIGLAAALLGLILGTWFYGTAGSWLTPYVSSADVSNFLGFLLVFMGTIIAGAILGAIVSRMLRTVGLSWIDRALGAAFGIARGLAGISGAGHDTGCFRSGVKCCRSAARRCQLAACALCNRNFAAPDRACSSRTQGRVPPSLRSGEERLGYARASRLIPADNLCDERKS